ncbi:MAG TPA: hypothetical protein VNB46_03065 [Gaiellaceae bacterium]|nr:hypothetical protein [Gaiellaceae bacterium]
MDGHYTTEDRGLEQQPPPAALDDFFREVNDRIVELGTRFGFRDDTLELICECDDSACTAHICIPSAEYERVRVSKRRHVVLDGHERSGRVVARRDGYVVVED